MPDENKFRALREVGYQIRPCCGLCLHGEFGSMLALWGRCKLPGNSYLHGKHTGDSRLGVLRYGCCEIGFDLDPARKAILLQSYSDLYVERDETEALLKDADLFQLEPRFCADHECPENECWTCSSPLLPDATHIAERTFQGALRAAQGAVREHLEKKE